MTKEKSIATDMGDSLHAEICIIGDTTLRIESRCLAPASFAEKIGKSDELARIEKSGEDKFLVTQVCTIPIKMLQGMMKALKQDSDGEYWFEYEEGTKAE